MPSGSPSHSGVPPNSPPHHDVPAMHDVLSQYMDGDTTLLRNFDIEEVGEGMCVVLIYLPVKLHPVVGYYQIISFGFSANYLIHQPNE